MDCGDHARDYAHFGIEVHWPAALTAHLEAELRKHFSDAWVSGYESLIPHPHDES